MFVRILSVAFDALPWIFIAAAVFVAYVTAPLSGGTALAICLAVIGFRLLWRDLPGAHAAPRPRYRRNKR